MRIAKEWENDINDITLVLECDIVDIIFPLHMIYINGLYQSPVYDIKRLSHGWQCDMIFIKRVVVRYHERARNE